jgi:hypothetical protein
VPCHDTLLRFKKEATRDGNAVVMIPDLPTEADKSIGDHVARAKANIDLFNAQYRK